MLRIFHGRLAVGSGLRPRVVEANAVLGVGRNRPRLDRIEAGSRASAIQHRSRSSGPSPLPGSGPPARTPRPWSAAEERTVRYRTAARRRWPASAFRRQDRGTWATGGRRRHHQVAGVEAEPRYRVGLVRRSLPPVDAIDDGGVIVSRARLWPLREWSRRKAGRLPDPSPAIAGPRAPRTLLRPFTSLASSELSKAL